MDAARLKLAVQKAGRLTDPSLDLLVRCGLKLSRGKDQLVGYGENMPLDVLFVRDDDIPDLVQEDVCDLGLLGLNVLEEKRLEFAARGGAARFMPVRRLDFGRCRLSLAIPTEAPWQGVDSLRGKRIATTYPFLLERFLREREVTAHIVTLAGAVERRSEEHTSELQSRVDLVCRLLLEKKKKQTREVQHRQERHDHVHTATMPDVGTGNPVA